MTKKLYNFCLKIHKGLGNLEKTKIFLNKGTKHKKIVMKV